MIVFGGYGYGVEQAVAGGGRYSPSTNSWQNIDSAGQPSARYGWAGAWTGTEMIVQGGNTTTGPTYSDGALYHPSRNAWTPAMGSGPGRERYGASSLWTGEELWLFGGRNAARQLISEPVAYIPPRTLYLYQKN